MRKLKIWLLKPFLIPVESIPRFLQQREVCRIILGFVLCHKFLNTLGFAFASNWPQQAFLYSIIALLLSLFLFLGLFVPLATLGLLTYFWFFSLYSNLADQASIFVLWGLLFSGAGQGLSLDYWIGKKWPAIQKQIYSVKFPLNTESIASLRLTLLSLMWGISLCAMAQHLKHPYWRNGRILELTLQFAYFNDFHSWVAAFSNFFPKFFRFLCLAMWAIQSVWETLLVPLMYVKGGKHFVKIQGYLFVLVSLLAINLGYLPYVELCLWVLIFGLPKMPLLRSKHKLPSALEEKAIPSIAARLFHWQFAVGGMVSILYSLGIFWGTFYCKEGERKKVTDLVPWVRFYGQGEINVFNDIDLRAGRQSFVVFAKDQEAPHKLRLVPFLDKDGGRLSYLKNDVLYYGKSLPWQKIPRGVQFDGEKIGLMTESLLDSVLRIDACLNRNFGSQKYIIAVVQHYEDVAEETYKWKAPNTRLLIERSYTPAFATRLDRFLCDHSFILPPNHFLAQNRIRETLNFFGQL